MRTVAVAIALLSLFAGFPTAAAAVDECATPGAVGSFCREIPVQPSSPISGVGVPPTEYWGKYYLWIGAGHCANYFNDPNGCTSSPIGDESGIPMPTGDPIAGPHVVTILFRETNGLAGLQRSPATAAGRGPDATVLL